MEVKFSKQSLQCLQPTYHQVHTQEQTQELRLPEGYPDIGKVLGSWGQVIIREKEWRGNGMSASGGVMAWVLYAPEDAAEPCVVEAWIPFQCRWDFYEPVDDGIICLCPALTGMDARGISARKIMLRAQLDVLGQAMNRGKIELPIASELPDDVQLLKRNYPMDLPVEAGEKQVSLDENISISGVNPTIGKIVYYQIYPEVTEQKIIGNRLVFRGQCELFLTYLCENGTIHKWRTDIPFSQFTELDHDYNTDAVAWSLPIVTALEMSMSDNQELHVQVGLAVQYTIFERNMIELVEDAYSLKREVTMSTDAVQIPALLDSVAFEMDGEGVVNGDVDNILDGTVWTEYPTMQMLQQDHAVRLDGQIQVVYQNNGDLQQELLRFKRAVPYEMAPENDVLLWPGVVTQYSEAQTDQGTAIKVQIPVTAQIYSGTAMNAVSVLEIGEQREADPKRPAMIIRRVDGEDLWSIAKSCGSTVSIIRQANDLVDEPSQGQMLLIPVP